MAVKLVFLALLFVVFAQAESGFLWEVYSEEEALRLLTEEGRRKISEAMMRVANAPKEYANITTERMESLLWDCTSQKNTVMKNIRDAVSRGMEKSKKFSNFQCVATKGQEALEKLAVIENAIPKNTEDLLQKIMTEVNPLKTLVRELASYLEALLKTKTEEVNQTVSADVRQKILQEVMQKMKLLETVLEQTNQQVTEGKFKFFEGYIQYVLTAENAMKKIQKEAADKIKTCVN